MGELAASLSHEISQPVAAAAMDASACLRWMQRESPDIGEACDAVSRVGKEIKRTADIIERNRSLFKRDTPQRELVDLNEIIREIVILMRHSADRHSVSIRTEFDPALPAAVADRVQLQQVLINLMLNGIEAMKDTSGDLAVTSKRSDDGWSMISVSDSGVGLPIDKPERIFDTFFTTKVHGLGMGLCICRRIIESHGGHLWATANKGRGATLHFALPTAVTSPSSV
jgi:signal transduction histidine kinase